MIYWMMNFRKDIIFNYLQNKPDNPEDGDCYQDDLGFWIYHSKGWYFSMSDDLDIIKDSRNKKINRLLDDE